MIKAMIFLGMASVVVLTIATIFLAYINRSPAIWTPVVSSFAVGIFTLFVTLMLRLEPSTHTSTFVTTIVMDDATKLPIGPLFPNTSDDMRDRFLAYYTLSRTATVSPPTTVDEEFRLCDELVQHSIVRDLCDMRSSTGVTQTLGGPLTIKQRVAVAPSDMTEMKGTEFITNANASRFLNSEFEKAHFEISPARLPHGTSLTINHQPGSPSTGPERHTIVLDKPNFFTAEITIQSVGGGAPGSLLEKLHADGEGTKAWKTYVLKVTCEAHFHRWTAGNSYSEEYKKWLVWLFSELESRYSDV